MMLICQLVGEMGTAFWCSNFFQLMLGTEVRSSTCACAPRQKTNLTTAKPQDPTKRLKHLPSIYLPYFLSYWPFCAPSLGNMSQIKV